MFGSRRRVPSEGALRVLRQLAYISSGTACGAAALIAEERRRQISMVSKIADNSRRLKQHPRYQHSHANVRPSAESASHDDSGDGGQDESLPAQLETFRNNILPSEVDKGYAKLNSKPECKSPSEGKRVKKAVIDLAPFVRTFQAHGPVSTLAHLDAHCKGILQQGLPAHAFAFFRGAVDRFKLSKQYTAETLATSNTIFDFMLQAKSYPSCRSMVRWMKIRELSIGACVEKFAHHCALHGDHDTIIWLYHNHGSTYDFSQESYAALCAAYSTHQPESAALILAKHVTPAHRPLALSTCRPAWLAILDHLWTTTHNLDLIHAIFEDMCRMSDPQRSPLDLYNQIIHICIRAGDIDRAHQHLQTIQQSHLMEPDIVTYGHFVLLAAKSSDWPAIDQLMAMLTRAGKNQAPSEQRTKMFIPVLVDFAKDHNPAEIWTFVTKAFDEYGILPSPQISNIVVRALARANHHHLIPAWIKYIGSMIDVQINPRTAFDIMRRYYFDYHPHHAVMMWLFRRLVRHVPEYASENVVSLLREAVAYDLRRIQPRRAQLMEQAKLRFRMLRADNNNIQSLPSPLYWTQALRRLELEQINTSSHGESIPCVSSDSGMDETPAQSRMSELDYKEMEDSSISKISTFQKDAKARLQRESQMLIAISTGQYSDAVKIYKESLRQSGLPASSYSLEMAIQAEIKSHEPAPELFLNEILAAKEAGSDTTAAMLPFLIYQIRRSPVNSPMHVARIFQTVYNFYHEMAANHVPVRHHLAAAAATVLNNNKMEGDAIRLLSGIYRSSWTMKMPFDMPAMTIFLQAYIQAAHLKGIKWVMHEILRHNYRIDTAFLLVLRGAQKRFHKRSSLGRATDARNLELSMMLERYAYVFSRRRREQIRHASRVGNKLVHVLIKVAKGEPAVEAPSTPRHFYTAVGRTLKDRKGRLLKFRFVGARISRASLREERWRRLQYVRDSQGGE